MRIIAPILFVSRKPSGIEGGLAARHDAAGAVNFGITQRFLRQIGQPASAPPSA